MKKGMKWYLVFLLWLTLSLVQAQTTVFLFTFENTLLPFTENAVGTPVFSSKGVGGLNFNATTPCEGGYMYQGSYWTPGDVYQFKVNTTGYSGLVFSWCERGSNALMGNFLLRVSPDSSNWTVLIPAYVPATTNTTQTTPVFPASCENAPVVFIQIYKVDEAGSTGRSLRIDNSLLTGTNETSPPVAAFNPAAGETGVLINVNPLITFDEPVMKTDGTPITNADLPSLVDFRLNNSNGAAVPFAAAINSAKTVITVVPSSNLLFLQPYYLSVGPVEDGLGNESGLQSATFTTMVNVISSDATLSDLRADDVTVPGFNPQIFSYSLEVPFGTTTVPTVTATPSFGMATVVVTPAAAMPGTTTVLVTAQDGVTQHTYSVAFTWAPPGTDASLSSLKWMPASGVQSIYVTGFSPGTLNYTMEIPLEVEAVSMSAVTAHPGATLLIIPPIDLAGDVTQRTGTVVVTAQDGVTSQTYSVVFSYPAPLPFHFKEGFETFPPASWTYSGNISLSTANGTGIYFPGLNSPKFKWTAPADGGILNMPVCNTAGTLMFYVRVLDNNPASQLHFFVEKSTNGGADWTVISSDPMPMTASTAIWHQVIVPVNDNSPSVMLRFRGSAITGTTSTGLFYLDDVSLTMNPAADASLSDLKVNGNRVAGFSSQVMNYMVLLPPATVTPPQVTAVAAQPGASVVVTNAAAIPGQASVVVTAENGINTNTYTIDFADSLQAPYNLTVVQVPGAPVDLSWDDSNTGETGFRIERQPSGGLFAHVAHAGPNAGSAQDDVPGPDPDAFVPADRFASVTVTSAIKFANVINYLGVPIPLYLDVYTPTGDTTLGRPVIIWIHGGGFRTDSYRTQGYIVDYCTRFAKRGYVCISIDYRLRDASAMPDQAAEFPALQDASRDANAAISWIKEHADEWKIDPNLIFIAGGSAGGRTAQTVCQFDGPDTLAVYPPENQYVNTPWNKTGLIANATLWGGLEPEMRGWVYPYLQPSDIPTILVHGEADVTILPQYSIDLYDTLTATGVHAELHIVPGATHSCLGHEAEIAAWVAAFFAQEWNHLNARATSYRYRINAFNTAGRSAYSNSAGWPAVDSITESGCRVKVNLNVPGTSWFVVVPAGDPAPDAIQVREGKNAAGILLPSHLRGLVGCPAGMTEYTGRISGLDAGTGYDIYFIAENGVQLLQRVPTLVPFITLAPSVPVNTTVSGNYASFFCANATNTITVGGDAGTFTLESGGHVTLIAGSRIFFLPGTKVHPGGQMHGFIAFNGPWCGNKSAEGEHGTLSEQPESSPEKQNRVKVWPNPTSGNIRILLESDVHGVQAKGEVFDMLGHRVRSANIAEGSAEDISLMGLSPGLYLLRIHDREWTETFRIIRE